MNQSKRLFSLQKRQEKRLSILKPITRSYLQKRELKETNKQLERELKRKEKALAEAAALLVLQKKYQALWEDKDG